MSASASRHFPWALRGGKWSRRFVLFTLWRSAPGTRHGSLRSLICWPFSFMHGGGRISRTSGSWATCVLTFPTQASASPAGHWHVELGGHERWAQVSVVLAGSSSSSLLSASWDVSFLALCPATVGSQHRKQRPQPGLDYLTSSDSGKQSKPFNQSLLQVVLLFWWKPVWWSMCPQQTLVSSVSEFCVGFQLCLFFF